MKKHSWNYKGIENLCKCKSCGNKISRVTYYRGKHCRSCESKRRVELGITGYKGQNEGESNGNWQGGLSKLPYSFGFTSKLKDFIRRRDGYKCQNCDMTEKKHLFNYNRKLSIHHIDYNKENCKENNLITLCNKCNSQANFNHNYWIKYYNIKIINLIKKGSK